MNEVVTFFMHSYVSTANHYRYGSFSSFYVCVCVADFRSLFTFGFRRFILQFSFHSLYLHFYFELMISAILILFSCLGKWKIKALHKQYKIYSFYNLKSDEQYVCV